MDGWTEQAEGLRGRIDRGEPWVTIAHSVVYMPMRKEVVDYKIDPFGGDIFYGVRFR